MSPPLPSAPQRDADPYLGRVVGGKYRVESVIASGGMGTIYRAAQLPLERPVAIKILHPNGKRGEENVSEKRFLLEASILSRLSHPHIVTVYDYGRIEDGPDTGACFMAMELLGGETLHHRLKARGALTVAEALSIARQIARGAREAHRHGVIHRDLKPANVMLVPAGHGTGQGHGDELAEVVKVLDFGLVKVLRDASEELTMDGTFLGSPRYMAPEQIASGEVDERTDIYSLGVILYQMLCGRTPFEGDTNVHILMSHLNDPVPWMRDRAPAIEVSPVLEAFVRRLLEKKVAARPLNVDEMLTELRACEQALGIADNASAAISLPAPPRLPDSLRVPLPLGDDEQPTASFPGVSVMSSRAPAGAGASPSLPVTPDVAARTAQAAPAPRTGGKTLVLGATAAVVAVSLVGGAWLGRARDKGDASSPAAAVSAPTTAPAMRLVTVNVSSVPAGATVRDGDAVVGTTPATLSFDNDALRASPHKLTVSLSGYQPYTFLQGPIEGAERTSVNVPLLAEAEPVPAPRPPIAGTPVGGAVKGNAPPKPGTPGPPGISLTR